MPQESPIVEPVPVLGDNYIWMFASEENHYVAVDPGTSDEVIQWLDDREGRLSHILLTHHHADHIGGVAALQKKYNPQTIGFHGDASRLPALDRTVQEGDTLNLGHSMAQVLETPGHTLGHVVYKVGDALFSGDTLFSLGCGRLFEGTAEMMWNSLNKLLSLPDETRLFCAHEYTLTNHGFALSLEPENPDLLAMQGKLMKKNDQNQPTLPTTLAEEKRVNPFLRCSDQSLITHLGLEKKNPIERFAQIRRWRNDY
ncbi:MAG: hydroxyacylglutathione hydrolase [Magnetococcales bacterium]|nr:hydroxyacylglutathione hydrolase [Magnetococcales bacterium]